MKQLTIDRIEGQIAVCEDDEGKIVEIDLSSMPSNVTEGSVLAFDGVSYQIDDAEAARRKERIDAKMNSLFVD